MKHPYHLRVITDELNLITLVIVALAVALLVWLVIFLWQKMVEERKKIRLELPAAIVGEMFTREEFVTLHERLFETETKLEYIETRLDAHLEEAQQSASNG